MHTIRHLGLLLGLPLLLAPMSGLRAADDAPAFDVQRHLGVLSAWLEEETLAVGHLDLDRLDVAALKIPKADAADADDQKTILDELQSLLESQRKPLVAAGVRDLYLVVSLADLPQAEPFVLAAVPEGSDPQRIAAVLFSGDPQGPTDQEQAAREGQYGPQRFEVCRPVGQVVFCGARKTLERFQGRKPVARPELAPALGAAGTMAAGGETRPTSLQLAVILSDDQRRVLREMLPRLPPEWGGASSAVIAAGVQSAALGVDLQRRLSVQVVVQSADAEAAAGLQRFLDTVIERLRQFPEVRQAFPGSEGLIKGLDSELRQDRLVLTLADGESLARAVQDVLLPAFGAARRASRREETKYRLKLLGLAMHNFHDVHGSFPPAASYDGQGKPLLSWRVFLLPFLDQVALYKQFRLDEPWDSEHNRRLIGRMPDIFRAPTAGNLEPGQTVFLAPVGTDTIFSGEVGTQIRDITDGTSNTILLVEAAPDEAVTWTKPDDWSFDPEQPRQGLIGKNGEGFHALTADAARHFIDKDIALPTLRRLITKSDGEVVDDF